MQKRNIILDCDPGHDDAVALMLAGSSEELNLLMVSVEAGNQTLEKTGRNALNLVQFLSLNVPVALGRNKPLKRNAIICPEIHGESGLDGFDFLDLKIDFDKKDAVSLMNELLKKNKPVTIVATGPLTNVASLLLEHPECKECIEEIVLMGGSIGFGNVTPAAEFNILCDPEAADIVFNSGIVVKMMGLDVTRKVKVDSNILSKMEEIDNDVARAYTKLMKVFYTNQKKVFGFSGAPLHDPVTIVYLLNPSVVKLQLMNVTIDTTGGPSYGRTNCDQFDYLKGKKNAYVAIDIDVDKYFDIVLNALRAY